MTRPSLGAMCSIPQSWIELLIRLGSQWIVCSDRSIVLRLKSRRNWPHHAGHSSNPLAELCHFWLWVRSGRTSSSVVQLVGRTLYYVHFICQIFCKWFPHQGSILFTLTNLLDDIDLLVSTTNRATSICPINQSLHQLHGSIVTRQSCGMRRHIFMLATDSTHSIGHKWSPLDVTNTSIYRIFQI